MLIDLTDLDRGFLNNLKALTLRPKETVIGYLKGRRVNVYPPLQYAIIGVTLLTLVINAMELIDLSLNDPSTG